MNLSRSLFFLIILINLAIFNTAAYEYEANSQINTRATIDNTNEFTKWSKTFNIPYPFYQLEIKRYIDFLALITSPIFRPNNIVLSFLTTQLIDQLKILLLPSNNLQTDRSLKIKTDLFKLDGACINLQGKTLDLRELQNLLNLVNNNSNIGNIIWGDIPEEAKEIKEEIENKIIKNNREYNRYPNDFIHALLSNHVYKDHQERDYVAFDLQDENSLYNKYLTDWQVHKIYSYPEEGNYYGIVYINRTRSQLVLAHRGTTVKLSDLTSKNSSLKADLTGILGREIVTHQVAAYKVIKDAITDSKDLNYNLSVTGHSLGAWLAELSLYFSYRDFAFNKVKAVTFDSPGSIVHFQQLESNIINFATEFEIKNLNIVTYLSAPNFVNSCNKHVGKVYRLFPKISKPQFVEKIISRSTWLQEILLLLSRKKAQDSDSLLALWSIFGHSLNSIVATFDPDTGKPIYYEEVLDWPVIKYTPKVGKGQNMITNLVDSAINLFVPHEVINFKNTVEDSTIMALLAILSEVSSGRLDQKQYLKYFCYVDHDDAKGDVREYSIKNNLSDNEEFSLIYEGHYRTRKPNLFEDVLAENNKGSADWYLKELQKKDISNLSEGLAKIQLSNLKAQYNIIPNIRNIISSNTVTIDLLREQVLRLVSIDPNIKSILEGFLLTQVDNNTKGEIIASYLPESRLNNFVEINESLSNIDAILSKEQKVIISGLPGSGQSTCALEYAYRQRNKITGDKKIVRWFFAGSKSKIDLDYINLAAELGLSVNLTAEDRQQLIINLINDKIAHLNIPMLFIFDGVENFNDLKDYLINLPENVKVVITTNNSCLNDNIKHIKLSSFNEAQAKQYIMDNLKNKISEEDKDSLIRALKITDEGIMPYKLYQTINYMNAHELFSSKKLIADITEKFGNRTIIDLALPSLMKDPIAWKMLQYAAYLDPDFISTEIFKELFMIDEQILEKSAKTLISLSLINPVYKNNPGFKIWKTVQEAAKEYNYKHSKECVVPEETIHNSLLKVLNYLLPEVTESSQENWKIAGLFYLQTVKVLDYRFNTELAIQAELYSKLGKYDRYVTNNLKQSLHYEEIGLIIRHGLHSGNSHPSIVKSLNSISEVHKALGNSLTASMFEKRALKMKKKLHSSNKY